MNKLFFSLALILAFYLGYSLNASSSYQNGYNSGVSDTQEKTFLIHSPYTDKGKLLFIERPCGLSIAKDCSDMIDTGYKIVAQYYIDQSEANSNRVHMCFPFLSAGGLTPCD